MLSLPPIPLAPDPSTTARPGASKRPQNSGPGMAVVLPVYNAAGHIDEIVDRVAAFALTSPHYHFYFVNDGSSDSTGPRLRAALNRWGHPRVMGFDLATNLGKGAAVGHGFARAVAEAEYLAFLDGDLPYALTDLHALHTALAHADVAIGCRQHPAQVHRAPLRRHLLGRVFNASVRLGFGFPYHDTQAGLKAFRRAAARSIFANMATAGFSFDVEMLFLARRQGWRIVEVPVHLQSGHAFETRPLRLARISLHMAWDVLRIRTNALLGRYDPR